jgi:hypothetical protein
MRKPTMSHLTVLAVATRNGGRLPCDVLAHAGLHVAYGGATDIIDALHEASQARTIDDAAQRLLDRLNNSQMQMAGGFLNVTRTSRDTRHEMADRYAVAIKVGFGRIHGVTPTAVKECIAAGWLTAKWELTDAGRIAAKAPAPKPGRPSPAMATMLTAAVRNNGYLTADLTQGKNTRTYHACRDRGWITTDQRITFAGRDALRLFDADLYCKALPAQDVDFELARITDTKLPPIGMSLRTGASAPALLIPDYMVQYDVPAGCGANVVGYAILHRGFLRTIVDAQDVPRDGGVADTRIYIADSSGGKRYVATFTIEFCAYAQPGGPDRREHAAALLETRRAAHEKHLAAKTEPVPHANPNTERADTVVTVDDVAQLDAQSAAATASQHPTVPAAGERVDLGADGCGCPITEQVRPNGSSIEGTERVEHHPRCWNRPAPAPVTWQPPTTAESRALVEQAVTVMQDRIESVNTGIWPTGCAAHEAYTGMVGAGKNPAADMPVVIVFDDEVRAYAGAESAQTKALMQNLLQVGRDTSVNLATEPGQLVAQVAHGPSGLAAAAGISPAAFTRLSPAVTGDAVDELLPQLEQIRDAIVARLNAGDQVDAAPIAGDVRDAGYRVQLMKARIAARSDTSRQCLMLLEQALSNLHAGASNVAVTVLNRAARRLGLRRR